MSAVCIALIVMGIRLICGMYNMTTRATNENVSKLLIIIIIVIGGTLLSALS